MSQAKHHPVFEVVNTQQKAVQKPDERKVDNALGGLNPRYFQEGYTPQQSKRNLWANYGANFLS
jgi:hypothetical protein